MSDDDMDRLLTAVEAQLGSAWVEAAEWLLEQNQIADVEARVAAGDITGAVVGIEQAAERMASAIGGEYVSSGEAAAEWLDKVVSDKLVTFDQTNWRAIRWQIENKVEVVREIADEQRAVIRQVLQRGTQLATNPRVVARELRQSIGLTLKQEEHVQSYRRALENGDYTNALSRELRDRRSDRSLIAARRNGEVLEQAQIDSMVQRYRNNWVNYRGEVIARTEGLRVLHQGTEEMFQQAIQSGVVEHSRLVQQWNPAHDSRTRSSHRTMSEQQRLIGESFLTGDGYAIMYPGDPNAPLAEIAQCRCNRSTRLLAAGQTIQRVAA